jgi:hypothetical protein
MLVAACLMALTFAPAAALEPPTGKVVLTISGNVGQANAGRKADFDMVMLGRLPQHSFTTMTPWFSQPRKFSGPLLRDVLAAAGVRSRKLRAVALNDYKVDIPVEDAARFDVIVATLMDDRPMSVREKGPLFIVYPFDSHPELRSEKYFSRSAWQLRTLETE